ncbi:hypothetical protein TREMEDRAFT_62341 [Tremella mesenterica DSM 1558]|uniref:uncharacterized protein n=1 Tax=Tremella mesenterica (strain ATCC 24925 / CBS 8224 / DSM 1558 / NBRC 9311 / NRRL Y-6157 / RJB 2259-6 / UBC 559-6) TaxID=578456 RepID=UPI0003F49C58|nr:uncharacterized protein TREMEDRAFT_62341 [Tremella mesenterica DSM 1558]EIW69480.1 hypothetical protein TREMEDRAFT_62341 [Tremella mesenterica DSM 1558]
MSALLAAAQGPSKAYVPLPDDISPPASYANLAPVHAVTRNGTVVYTKRVSSVTSSGSGDSDDSGSVRTERHENRSGTTFQSGSEETLAAPGSSRKGKEKANGNLHEDGDLGHYTWEAKGKGKETWDVEKGPVEYIEMVDGSETGSYPPNLANFAARDMARRRAARLSRQLPSSPPSSPKPNGTTTSYLQRPLSIISSITSGSQNTSGKRNSLMGLMEGIGIVNPVKGKGDAEWGATHNPIPLTTSPRESTSTEYQHPYAKPASPIPRMVISPVSPTESPFDDPRPVPLPSSSTQRRGSINVDSSKTSAPLDTDVVGYAGPSWRGGAAIQDQGVAQDVQDVNVGTGEKWWHALCSWGSDVDGGHGNDQLGGQAGRTNPFE